MLNRINKFGGLNTYDVFKNVAFFAMVIDHIGYYFLPQIFLLRVIGRISMVIFAVLYGYSFSKRNNNILLYGILTAVFVQFFVEHDFLPLNVLFAFYISSFFINIFEYVYNKYYSIFCLFLVMFIPAAFISNVFVEYGISMLFLLLCGKIFKKENKTRKDVITSILIFVIYTLYQTLNFGFNLFEFLFLMLLLTIVYLYLFNLKIQKVDFNNKIMLFVSRYSLELYFIHLLIFSIMAKCLH